MTLVNIYQDDPACAKLKTVLDSLEKTEIPVKTWIYLELVGSTAFGPHYRIAFFSDGSSIFRSAWDRDAEGGVVQHDYLLSAAQTELLKPNLFYFEEIAQ